MRPRYSIRLMEPFAKLPCHITNLILAVREMVEYGRTGLMSNCTHEPCRIKIQQCWIAASLRQIVGYGLWCAGLGLIVLTGVTLALHLLAEADPLESIRLLAHRPAASLSLLVLAYTTCALITCAGFALGARAQARLLPHK